MLNIDVNKVLMLMRPAAVADRKKVEQFIKQAHRLGQDLEAVIRVLDEDEQILVKALLTQGNKVEAIVREEIEFSAGKWQYVKVSALSKLHHLIFGELADKLHEPDTESEAQADTPA